MLVDEKLATQQLVSGAKTDIAYKCLSEAGLQLTNEPFFKSLLVALYKERMQNLLKRARILLPTSEARLLIGVMDETGILKPGQVRITLHFNGNFYRKIKASFLGVLFSAFLSIRENMNL